MFFKLVNTSWELLLHALFNSEQLS